MLYEVITGMALGVGLGVFLDTKDYYIGVSMKNLTNPQPKFTDTYEMQLKRTIFVSGGYRYKVIDRPRITSYNVCYTKLLRLSNQQKQVYLS